jgi:hypothetical protein
MKRKDIVVGRLYNTDAGLAECVTVEPELTFRVVAPYPQPLPVTLKPRAVLTCIREADREDAIRTWKIYSVGGGGGHTHGR